MMESDRINVVNAAEYIKRQWGHWGLYQKVRPKGPMEIAQKGFSPDQDVVLYQARHVFVCVFYPHSRTRLLKGCLKEIKWKGERKMEKIPKVYVS